MRSRTAILIAVFILLMSSALAVNLQMPRIAFTLFRKPFDIHIAMKDSQPLKLDLATGRQ